MSQTQLLLAVVLLQQTLLCGVWLIAARLQLARRSSLHWAASAALMSCSMALILGRGQLPDLLSLAGGNALLVAAMVVLRRGVQGFLRLPASDTEHRLLLGGAAAGMVAAVLAGGGVPPVVALSGVAMGWTLLRTAHEMQRTLHTEYGVHASRWCAAVPALAGAVFMLRGLLSPLFPQLLAGSIVEGTGANTVVVFTGLSLGLVLNLMLVALVVMRLVMRLRHQSNHDALTGLLGRRPLQQRLQDAAALHRTGTRCAMLAVDIDHFKQINDRYGHQVGDAVLVRVAQALRAGSREGDSVARTGGEEFCLLLPGADREAARHVAQRLLDTVRALTHPEMAPGAVVTVSIGLATLGAHELPEQLLKRVDRALYGAKRAGRDRIQIAEQRPAVGASSASTVSTAPSA